MSNYHLGDPPTDRGPVVGIPRDDLEALYDRIRELEAKRDAAYLAGVEAGLDAAARAARGDGESEFFNPVQAIRALDPAAIARAAQKEGE